MSFVSETNQRIAGDASLGYLAVLPTMCVFLGLVVFVGLSIYTRRKRAYAKRISPLPLSNPKAQEAGLDFTSHYVRQSSPQMVAEKQEKEPSSISESALTTAPPPLPLPLAPQAQALPGAGPVFAQRPLPPHPPPFTPPMLDLSAFSNNPSPAGASLPDLSFSSSSTFEPSDLPPRRRSYTKMTTEGTEFSGEIVAAEGWRRHTRVFGGGVCEACLESQRRMSQ